MSPQGGFDLGDYNTVPERLGDFRARHPEGCLQAEIVEVPAPFSDRFLAVRAYAYRSPDDPRPGSGLAWEPMPGKTSFTRDSELQNAETAAWGRAIVAVLAADAKKGIASREEVQTRRAGDTDTQRRAVFAQLGALGVTDRDERLRWASEVLGRKVTTFTTLGQGDYTTLLEWFPRTGQNTDQAGDVGESAVTGAGMPSTSTSDPDPQGRGAGFVPTGPAPVHRQPAPPPPEDRRTELMFAIANAHAAWAKTMPKGAEAWMNGYLAHVHKKDLNECSLVELEAGWDWLVALHRDR